MRELCGATNLLYNSIFAQNAVVSGRFNGRNDCAQFRVLLSAAEPDSEIEFPFFASQL